MPAKPDPFFGLGFDDALKALKKELPHEGEWSDQRIRDYFRYILCSFTRMQRNQRPAWGPFMIQAIRLLALERVIKSRPGFLMNYEMHQVLKEIKETPE